MAHVRPTFTSATPHFFKIVLQNALRDKKIKIPKKFVSEYGGTLSSPVILKLPSGLEWKVGLTKSDGRLWLHKGWPEFAAHHSIDRGHLLVFRYEGSSQFYVLILDTDTTEIDYPIVSPTHLKEPKKEVEIIDDPIPKTGDKSLVKCPRLLKRTSSSVCTMSTPASSRLKSLSASERARALERVSAFKSENPYFTIVMGLSYVHGRNRVCMPVKFRERYKDKKAGKFNLQVSDGRSWSVQYVISRRSNGTIRGEIYYGGWKVFTRDNHLEVGDVCIFNLINANDMAEDVFEVIIDRRTDRGSNPVSHKALSDCTGKDDQANCVVAVNQNAEAKREYCQNCVVAVNQNAEAKREYCQNSEMENCQLGPKTCMALEEVASRENPFFQVLVKFYMEKSTMTIPVGFARSHLKEMRNNQNVKLRVENRWWEVKLVYYPHPNDRYMFASGWLAFARDNSLRRGDTCRFLMIEKNPIAFQVSITAN